MYVQSQVVVVVGQIFRIKCDVAPIINHHSYLFKPTKSTTEGTADEDA